MRRSFKRDLSRGRYNAWEVKSEGRASNVVSVVRVENFDGVMLEFSILVH